MRNSKVGWNARPDWEKAAKQDVGSINASAINQSVVLAQYAVMGELYRTAQQRLREGKEVIFTTWNP